MSKIVHNIHSFLSAVYQYFVESHLEFINTDMTVTLNSMINVVIPLKSFLIPRSKRVCFVPASIIFWNPHGDGSKVWDLFIFLLVLKETGSHQQPWPLTGWVPNLISLRPNRVCSYQSLFWIYYSVINFHLTRRKQNIKNKQREILVIVPLNGLS